MDSDESYLNNVRQLRLDRLKLMVSTLMPDEMSGVTIEPGLIYRTELKSLLLQIRASVTAAKREELPYMAHDEVVEVEFVPERPVRDGILLWLTQHAGSYRLFRFFRLRPRMREIPKRRQVMMQQIHYYGCPHIRVGSDKTDVHLMWMATQSGQITPDGSEQDA